MKVVRLVWVAGSRFPDVIPTAHVWVVQPSHAAAAARALAALTGGKPRMIVEGRCAPDAVPGAAVIEGGIATGHAVQRALQIGATAILAPNVARGAAVVGAAAWYHTWKLESDRSRYAGALVGAVAWRAATRGGQQLPLLEIDMAGGCSASPVDKAGTIARLLLEPGVGPSLPETSVDLSTVHLLETGPRSVRCTGTRSEGGAGGPAGLRVTWKGQTHEVGPTPSAKGSHAPLDYSERTMPVPALQPLGAKRVAARDVVRAWMCDHGDHTVLAVASRDPDHWATLEEWGTPERAADWFRTRSHVTRSEYPNLSAVRFVCAAADRDRTGDLAERVLQDEI